MADLSTTFRRPFREQIAAFRLRLGNLVPTERWDDITRAQHDRAFMVAGAQKADLLADLAAAVDKAISQGTSLEEFRRDFRATVTRRGWHGWTGEGSTRGEAWRTRVIYRTNIATSYAAGRIAQLVEGNFAFWIYRHGGSTEPRVIHLGWDGLVLPPDHPFWITHGPPNGWGCSCYVIGARNEASARRRGGDPDKRLPDDWQSRDPRTGAPKGIDKGWDYTPGATAVADVLALRDKLDLLPRAPSVDLIQSWLGLRAFSDWLAAPGGSWPLVRLTAEDAAALGATRQVADLSAETALKQLARHPELTPQDYALAQATVDGATRRIKDGPRTMIFIREAEDGHLLVVKATRSGEGLFVTSFRRISANPAERARLIRQFERRGIE